MDHIDRLAGLSDTGTASSIQLSLSRVTGRVEQGVPTPLFWLEEKRMRRVTMWLRDLGARVKPTWQLRRQGAIAKVKLVMDKLRLRYVAVRVASELLNAFRKLRREIKNKSET
jgi:hypothetical protein